jgi:hypothetical protein
VTPGFRPPSDDLDARRPDDLPPLDDPYLYLSRPGARPGRPRLSALALSAVIAPFLGPVGSIAAIVFGWSALREIDASGGLRRGRALARVGVALGVVLTCLWGAALALHVGARALTIAAAAVQPAPVRPAATGDEREPTASPTAASAAPASPSPAAPAISAPKQTRTRVEGAITVVDVGVAVTSLSEELAKQRAEASTAGQTVLVMTTAAPCDPCRGVDASLRDPLVQTALARIRLVRIDIPAFHDELDGLRVPHERFPGFFLLAPDLSPRDGIDGGEWDDDIARNIAPVLGAFVRGKYSSRREAWKPLPGTGVSL